jgi:hypothetical protein
MKKSILLLIFILIIPIGCTKHITYTPYMSGDCVDRAVIIRQDLRANGYEAELVLGLRGEKEGHCWVRYKDKDGKWKQINNF